MPVATPGDTATVRRTVTRETIQTYADLTGDDNPLHTDPDYAADGIFGGPVAHGMLTGGFVSAALAALPGDIVYLRQEFDFEAPVRPDAVVVCEATVREVLDGDRLRVETVAFAHDASGEHANDATDSDSGDRTNGDANDEHADSDDPGDEHAESDDGNEADPAGEDTDDERTDDTAGADADGERADGECVLRGEAVVLSVAHDD